MTQLGHDRFFTELEAETSKLADALHDADPECPEWTVAQLVEHVGLGHRWVSVIVERRATWPVPNDEADDRVVPASADGRSAWLLAGARRLGAAIRELGPQAGVWTWADDKTAGFWLHRITHDTLIHRVDAELTAGREVEIAPDLAADSISDLLMVLSTVPKIDDVPTLAELRGNGETLHFHATDHGLGAWLIRREPAGMTWQQGHAKADVAVRGRAADLLLVLSRRATPESTPIEVIGDEKLFAHWLDHSVF